MQKIFEKIKERLEEYAHGNICSNHDGCPYRNSSDIACENCGAIGAIDIVNQVAEEHEKDMNYDANAWKIIYDKVLELEERYAESGDVENVEHCIKLENLLQYFKENLQEEYDDG